MPRASTEMVNNQEDLPLDAGLHRPVCTAIKLHGDRILAEGGNVWEAYLQPLGLLLLLPGKSAGILRHGLLFQEDIV